MQKNNAEQLNTLKEYIKNRVKQKLEEMTTTGDVAGYATPYAFSRRGTKNNATKYIEKLGFTTAKSIDEDSAPVTGVGAPKDPKYSTIDKADVSQTDVDILSRRAKGLQGNPEIANRIRGVQQRMNQLLAARKTVKKKDKPALPRPTGANLGPVPKKPAAPAPVAPAKKKLNEAADPNAPVAPTAPAQAPQAPTADAQPAQAGQDDASKYNVWFDFSDFEKKILSATEQQKDAFQSKLSEKIKGKQIVARASKGYGQPKKDYVVNISSVGVDYYYDRYVVVLRGIEEGRRKESEYFLEPGYKITIKGDAQLPSAEKKTEEPAQDTAAQQGEKPSSPQEPKASSEPLPEPKKQAAPGQAAPGQVRPNVATQGV